MLLIHSKKIKVFAVAIGALTFLLMNSKTVLAEGFTPSFDVIASSAYMINLDTNQVVYEHQPNELITISGLT